MEFYGFTRKNNSSVVITIPSKLNIKENVQVRVIVEVINPMLKDNVEVLN